MGQKGRESRKMGVTYLISHENREILNTDRFVEELKKKWPEVKMHFISDPKARSILQFSTSDDFWLLGDFYGTGVSYRTDNTTNTVQFALWYRSIVPSE